jgi:large subunit ribosomal protein L4
MQASMHRATAGQARTTAFGSCRPSVARTVVVRAAIAAKPVDVPVKSADGASVGSEQLSLRVAPNDTAKGLVHRYLVYVQQNARRVSYRQQWDCCMELLSSSRH